MFALRQKLFILVAPRHEKSEAKESARLPRKTHDYDLEAAIDDMIERFPKTLEYLAR